MIRTRVSLALFAAAALTVPAAAQTPEVARTGPSAAVSAVGADVETEAGPLGSVSARLSPAGTPAGLLVNGSRPALEIGGTREGPPAPVPQARDRDGIPFMVAGAALFVSGAGVGDRGGTILMVGGAGIGAYGLFVYFGGEPE